MFGRRVTRALRPQELARHPEVDDKYVVVVEPTEEVLAPPVDAGDLAVDETADELLAVVMPTNGTHAVDVDRLDLLADDLTVEITADDLDFG
jgi:hypothetical protein